MKSPLVIHLKTPIRAIAVFSATSATRINPITAPGGDQDLSVLL